MVKVHTAGAFRTFWKSLLHPVGKTQVSPPWGGAACPGQLPNPFLAGGPAPAFSPARAKHWKRLEERAMFVWPGLLQGAEETGSL